MRDPPYRPLRPAGTPQRRPGRRRMGNPHPRPRRPPGRRGRVGTARRTRRFHRATHGLRRLVLLGHTGYITLEAIRWLTDTGIALIHIDQDGRVLATTGSLGSDQPALRRAQALAASRPVGLEITRSILHRKLDRAGRGCRRHRRPRSRRAGRRLPPATRSGQDPGRDAPGRSPWPPTPTSTPGRRCRSASPPPTGTASPNTGPGSAPAAPHSPAAVPNGRQPGQRHPQLPVRPARSRSPHRLPHRRPGPRHRHPPCGPAQPRLPRPRPHRSGPPRRGRLPARPAPHPRVPRLRLPRNPTGRMPDPRTPHPRTRHHHTQPGPNGSPPSPNRSPGNSPTHRRPRSAPPPHSPRPSARQPSVQQRRRSATSRTAAAGTEHATARTAAPRWSRPRSGAPTATSPTAPARTIPDSPDSPSYAPKAKTQPTAATPATDEAEPTPATCAQAAAWEQSTPDPTPRCSAGTSSPASNTAAHRRWPTPPGSPAPTAPSSAKASTHHTPDTGRPWPGWRWSRPTSSQQKEPELLAQLHVLGRLRLSPRRLAPVEACSAFASDAVVVAVEVVGV